MTNTELVSLSTTELEDIIKRANDVLYIRREMDEITKKIESRKKGIKGLQDAVTEGVLLRDDIYHTVLNNGTIIVDLEDQYDQLEKDLYRIKNINIKSPV